jgi:hypothetical protein
MRVTTRGWQTCALIYRILVGAQTLGWAVASLARIVTRDNRSSQAARPITLAFAVGLVLAIAAGFLTYLLRRPRSHDRDSVVLTWAWLQAVGLLALAGYAVTGAGIYFVVGVVTLAVMHAFSPNRFQTSPTPKA